MNMVFPTEDEVSRCTEWCAPIHKVEAMIRGRDVGKYFVIEDFMCMGKVVDRQAHPDLILNKHVFTRRYLNLDADGRAYRYIEPDDIEVSPGTYVLLPSIEVAVDRLELVKMPWMCPQYKRERRGLSVEQRFQHPDVIAWEERMATYAPDDRGRRT